MRVIIPLFGAAPKSCVDVRNSPISGYSKADESHSPIEPSSSPSEKPAIAIEIQLLAFAPPGRQLCVAFRN
jgi:hypothetical protein